jgi:transcriptional regulator NrdR family protein
MNCPECGSDRLQVADKRIRNGLIQRRRKCLACDHRFNTVEITMDLYEAVVAVAYQKQWLVEQAQKFSECVQYIMDTIPDKILVK